MTVARKHDTDDARSAGKVLLSFAGGAGHLNPCLPLVRALQTVGWTVGIGGRRDVMDGAAGFDAYFPYSASSSTDETTATTGTLARPDLDHEFQVIGTYFASTLAHRHAEQVREIIDLWQPDLLVCDDMDFGAMIAAEHAGIPRIIVNVIASGALTRIEHVHEPLATLRHRYGLPADPALAQLTRDIVISPAPPSFRHPSFPLPPGAISVRTEAVGTDSEHPAVTWLTRGNELHRVYVTLGTIFNTESGDLFIRILEGLRTLPVRVLATVGPAIDPASIPVIADNIRIERFVPQSAILEHCNLVINHAGSGSVLGALAHGIPLITLPMGADQELNAERLTDLGAGITLDPITVTSADIRETTKTVLTSKAMHVASRRLQRENHDLPTISDILDAVLTKLELTASSHD